MDWMIEDFPRDVVSLGQIVKREREIVFAGRFGNAPKKLLETRRGALVRAEFQKRNIVRRSMRTNVRLGPRPTVRGDLSKFDHGLPDVARGFRSDPGMIINHAGNGGAGDPRALGDHGNGHVGFP